MARMRAKIDHKPIEPLHRPIKTVPAEAKPRCWQNRLARFLDFALSEAVATFDQLFQPLDEPSGGCAIDQIMIEAQGQAEIFADGNLPVDDAWLRIIGLRWA